MWNIVLYFQHNTRKSGISCVEPWKEIKRLYLVAIKKWRKKCDTDTLERTKGKSTKNKSEIQMNTLLFYGLKNSTRILEIETTLTSWIMLKTSFMANGIIPGESWSPCKCYFMKSQMRELKLAHLINNHICDLFMSYGTWYQ